MRRIEQLIDSTNSDVSKFFVYLYNVLSHYSYADTIKDLLFEYLNEEIQP